MPHFVTDISPVLRASSTKPEHGAFDLRAARAYRLRLAALRTRAPDTLCARVRRVLRQADATMTRAE